MLTHNNVQQYKIWAQSQGTICINIYHHDVKIASTIQLNAENIHNNLEDIARQRKRQNSCHAKTKTKQIEHSKCNNGCSNAENEF